MSEITDPNSNYVDIDSDSEVDWAGLDDNYDVELSFVDEVLSKSVGESLVKRGYALALVDEPFIELRDGFQLALQAFCEQPLETEKFKFAIKSDDTPHSPNQFHGYSRMEGLKEQFMIRAGGKNTTLPLPNSYFNSAFSVDSPHFGKTALRYYEELDQLCRRALYSAVDHLNMGEEGYKKLEKILDPVPSIEMKYPFVDTWKRDTSDIEVVTDPVKGDICTTSYVYPGYISTSLLDVFCYQNTFNKSDGSHKKYKNNHLSHSDSGILTAVPISDVPALEVFDQTLQKWIALERLVHKWAEQTGRNHKNYVTVFWGDSHEYLSKENTSECMHRVARCDDLLSDELNPPKRFSHVFKMRTFSLFTAPRYQEDYELSLCQLKSLESAGISVLPKKEANSNATNKTAETNSSQCTIS
eukprot:TRINITY_DN470_c0_g1_i4.p1 TRINITY_DN470_c0_g1~~TRINITY_DN470_c0_g1_i4.p1  ORF type:complete len:413 (+),score=81.41 TRINITY_DN470_c0_g1_i4:1941-3179(+)